MILTRWGCLTPPGPGLTRTYPLWQATLSANIQKLEMRLSAPGFADKAKPAVVEKTRNELAEQKEKLNGVRSALEKLPT